MNPNKCCETCAFRRRKSGGASSETSNYLEARICAHAAIPFYCHHRPDGTEWDWRAGLIAFTFLTAKDKRVCAGWKAMVRSLFTQGWRWRLSAERISDKKALIAYQRSLGQSALKYLRQFIDMEPGHEEEKAWVKKQLMDSLRAVFSK